MLFLFRNCYRSSQSAFSAFVYQAEPRKKVQVFAFAFRALHEIFLNVVNLFTNIYSSFFYICGMDVKEYGIVLANDITNPDQALQVSKQVAPFVDAIKLGLTTTLPGGLELIRCVKGETGRPIVADFKIADIGARNRNTRQFGEGSNAKIIGPAIDAGADYVICHTIVGTSSIHEDVQVAHERGGKVLTLPYMTHEGAPLFFDQPIDPNLTYRMLTQLGYKGAIDKLEEIARSKLDGKWRLPYLSVSDLIFALGEDIGVDGYIGPANLPDVLKDYRKVTSRQVFATGVGRQGGRLDVMFPLLRNRAYAIIGSDIYGASNPAEAAEQFALQRDEVAKGL